MAQSQPKILKYQLVMYPN